MVKQPQNVVGPLVQAVRKKLCWPQKVLATRCQLLGWDVSRGTIAKIECQARPVGDYELFCMAEALKTPVQSLLPASAEVRKLFKTIFKPAKAK